MNNKNRLLNDENIRGLNYNKFQKRSNFVLKFEEHQNHNLTGSRHNFGEIQRIYAK
jgi:hypothetical protein